MSARFPLYTDADVRGPLVDALREQGWDVVRAIDAFPEGTPDEIHFEAAAKEGRVFITNDQRIEAIANLWLAEGRAFRGLIIWPQRHYQAMTVSVVLDLLGDLVEPFGHPVIHLKPR